MKRFFKVEGVAILLAGFFVFTVVAFGAEAVPDPAEIPQWFRWAVEFIVGLPVIGPWLLIALKYVSMISAVFTALTTAFMTITKAMEKIGLALGMVAFANKVKDFHDMVYPYLAYLSIYNGPVVPVSFRKK